MPDSSKDLDVVSITREELRELMSEAITQAFTDIGINTSDPFATQRDMAHLRKWRVAVEQASSTSFKIVLGTLITGLIGAAWLGFSQMIGK